MITYILKTINNEVYCGKTKDLDRRIKEHKRGDGWFQFRNRNEFKILFIIEGDYEKKIKKFGVLNFIEVVTLRCHTP